MQTAHLCISWSVLSSLVLFAFASPLSAQLNGNRFAPGGNTTNPSMAQPTYGGLLGRQLPRGFSPTAFQAPPPNNGLVRQPVVPNANAVAQPNVAAPPPRNWQGVANGQYYPGPYGAPAAAPPGSVYPGNPMYPQPLAYHPAGVMPGPPNGQIVIPDTNPDVGCAECIHVWKWLPDDLLYRSYLAGPLEPRLGQMWVKDEERGTWVWDAAIGGRLGIIRKGTFAPIVSEGWQLDVEGAAFPRFDLDNDGDFESVVFRWGIPLTYRKGRTGLKISTYHLRAHIGDEFLIRVPGLTRNNYEKAGLILGTDYYLNVDTRLYGEVAYALVAMGEAEQWDFQFGAEYSPADCFDTKGRPFVAVNVYLRQEVDYRDGFNAVAGWQWNNPVNGRRFRVGVQYFYGKSMQLAFMQTDEELLGLGIWYDF